MTSMSTVAMTLVPMYMKAIALTRVLLVAYLRPIRRHPLTPIKSPTPDVHNANVFRSDTYRGRTVVGEVRKMRKQSGLSERIPWSVDGSNGCDNLAKFYTFLMRCKVGYRNKCEKSQVNMISKLMYFVQSAEGMPTTHVYADAFINNHEHVERYLDRLSIDLDDSHRGFGLQPSAMKNEFVAIMKYCQFLKDAVVKPTADRQCALKLAKASIKIRIKKNMKSMNKITMQKYIQIEHEDVDNEAWSSAYALSTNEKVKARIASIVEKYGPNGTDTTRNESHKV